MRPEDQTAPVRRETAVDAVPATRPGQGGGGEVEALRRDIGQTRGNLTDIVEAIGDRLNPETLTDQVKEITDHAVQEATERAKQVVLEATDHGKEAAKELADHAIGEAKLAVREITGEAGASVRAATIGKVERMAYETRERMNEAQMSIVDVVKQNPLASALVGLGLGWLFMNRGAGSTSGKSSAYGNAYQQRYGAARQTYTRTGPPVYDQRAGQGSMPGEGEGALRGAIDRVQDTAEDVVDQVKDVAYDARGTATDVGSTVLDLIKGNPVPSALAGLSIGYLLLNNSGATRAPQVNQARGEARRAFGQVRGDAERTADQVKGQVERTADQVKDTAERTADQVKDQAERVVGDVQDAAGDVADKVQATTGRVAGDIQERVGSLGSDLDYTALRTRMRFQEVLSENPLAVGAAAFLLGAVIGLPVPQSQPEQNLMNQASSQFVDRAQSVAQDAIRRVQHVAEETQNTVEREAKSQGLAS